MADGIAGTIESVARDWRAEAERRRGISATDPVADTLAYCAGEIETRVRSLTFVARDGVTVDAFAATCEVTAQTVRQWCRRAMVPAQLTSRGWLIAATAKRPGAAKKSA